MTDYAPTPPPKPRGLLLIMLSLIATMIIVLLLWRTVTSPSLVNWSVLLENINKGEVAKTNVGPEFAKVTATPKAGGHEYQVYYVNDQFGEAGQKELNEKLRAYNLAAKENDVSPIENVRSVHSGAFIQWLPTLLMIGISFGLFYYFVLRRMEQGDGAVPFGKSHAQPIAKQSWLDRWKQRRAVRAIERRQHEEDEEQLILDRLLEKVGKQGLPSLTAAERTALHRISRKQKARQETGVL
jgi:hypothetical protein